MNFLREYTLVGNNLLQLLGLFISILISLVLGKIARLVFERRGKKLEQSPRLVLPGLVLNALSKPITLVLLLVGLKVGLLFVTLPPGAEGAAQTALSFLTAITVAYIIYSLIVIPDYYITRFAVRTKSKIDDMLAPLIRRSLRIVVAILLVAFLAENLYGKPLTSLLAGLGIGALAFALAGQEILKNFFGSMIIMTDKPFQIGERVKIGGHDGPVEEVGFRSTKIRTLDGHLVTVPNSEVASQMVQNIQRRPFIRRVANITITYDTPCEKVERAIEIIKDILHNHEGMRPDLPPRVFFNKFNDCSLNIIVIYWYHPPNYWDYLAFSEKVNKEIFRRFNEEGIEFAFPTQTVYLANDAKRQLALNLLNKDLRRSAEMEG